MKWLQVAGLLAGGAVLGLVGTMVCIYRTLLKNKQ